MLEIHHLARWTFPPPPPSADAPRLAIPLELELAWDGHEYMMILRRGRELLGFVDLEVGEA